MCARNHTSTTVACSNVNHMLTMNGCERLDFGTMMLGASGLKRKCQPLHHAH